MVRFVKEENVVRKKWSKVDLKICLCYPNVYEIGCLNLAMHILYYLWNEREDVLCERSFLNVEPMGTSIERVGGS